MSLNYKNPLTSTQLDGSNSVSRTSVFGTNFSVLQIGGYMEVYSLSDLTYTIPPNTTGLIQDSGNTIPIQFNVSPTPQTVPNILTLNSDNISSGRQRLGMLVYVYENNLTYQLRIRDYDTLWNNAINTQDIFETEFGTSVTQLGTGGYAFVNAWTATTIEGVNGYTKDDAKWIVYQGDGGGSTVTGGTTTAGTGATTAITMTLSANNQSSGVTIDMSPALTYYNDEPVKRTVGGIIDNSNPFTGGKTIQQIIDEIFYPADKPTIVYSTVSQFTSSQDFTANSLYEIGFTGNITLNATFNRGTSTAPPQEVKRMGLPNLYTFSGPFYFENQDFGTSDLSQSTYSVSIFTEQGYNTFNVSVNYVEGEIPLYDTGSPYYDASFTNAGTKSNTLRFEGVYPIFANTGDISSSVGVKQPLISMITATTIDLNYTETEQNTPGYPIYRHYFDFPTSLWGKSISQTRVYSTLANAYVPIPNFVNTGPVSYNIEGFPVTYDRYTCQFATTAGPRQIRLILS
jgi:hypothetical protein